MRRLLVSVFLLASACTSALPAPSPTPAATAAPPALSPTTRIVALGNGLVIDIPERWTLSGPDFVNRATQRLLLAGNGELEGLPGLPGNGDVDAANLPSGRVVIEVETFCRLGCRGPESETAVPPDWSTAAPVFASLEPALCAAGRHEVGVAVRWFDLPIYVVARWADDAPAADLAAISLIAQSLRADPPLPATGEYRGWAGLGPIAAIPVGGVLLVPLPQGAAVRPPGRLLDNEPFFIVHEPLRFLAFSSKPLVDRRCVVAFDTSADQFHCIVDGRTFSWTRLGMYLGPEPASDMQPLTVILRDGSVWVAYSN